MRQLDSGGPVLIMTFCAFLIIAACVLYENGYDLNFAYSLLGIGISVISIFLIRLQTGYFDIIRKIGSYIKSKGNPDNYTNSFIYGGKSLQQQ